MTSRRGFLQAIAVALVLDPERLLWRPGAKLISVPSLATDMAFPEPSDAEVDEFIRRYIRPAMSELANQIDREVAASFQRSTRFNFGRDARFI